MEEAQQELQSVWSNVAPGQSSSICDDKVVIYW